MRTIKTRIFSCLLAVMLAIPAFSMSALAAGTDPEATESIPTTGGIEFDTPETDSSLSPEDTADTEDGASKEDTEETEASADNAAILACQMLALSDEGLAAQLAQMKEEMAQGVAKKNAALQEKVAAL